MSNTTCNAALNDSVLKYIIDNFNKGSTILEFGSGHGSAKLAEHFNLFSVEHDKHWMNLYEKVNYIYAPIKEHKEVKKVIGKYWYDWRILEPQIRNLEYDLIIVDGPPARFGRAGFLKYMIPLKRVVPIIFDDLDRGDDFKIAYKTSARLKKPILVSDTWEYKSWGIIK